MSYKVNIKHRNTVMMEFKCPDNHQFMLRDYSDTSNTKCPECHKEAKRVIGAPHLSAKMGTDPNSAQGERWARMHREEAKRQNAQVED